MAQQTSTIHLVATPEKEDFAHKYTEEGSGKIGGALIEGYFSAVLDLFSQTGLADQAHAKAIEIGCGEGYSTERLRKLLPQNITLEASEYVGQQVAAAQKRNPGITITEESIYQTKHANNQFDLVFLLEVLEHLDHPDKALAELKRIIKPGGFLILGVPREPLWRMLNMLRFKYLSAFGNTPGHLNHWGKLGLLSFATEHFGPIQAVRNPIPWTLTLTQKIHK